MGSAALWMDLTRNGEIIKYTNGYVNPHSVVTLSQEASTYVNNWYVAHFYFSDLLFKMNYVNH